MKKKYILPSVDLLKKNSNRKKKLVKDDSESRFRIIEKTLEAFGINALVCGTSRRDSSDYYKLMLDSNTTVSDITSHSEDIRVALSADSIRIEEPTAKENIVGIEIPCDVQESLLLRDIIESSEFQDDKSNLAFGVGVDASGNAVISDFEQLPGILIGGKCWSGSSDFIDSMIVSILYKAHPADVKFIMIDPTILYLPVYNGIPHMLMPVITDPHKGCSVLTWIENEVHNRHMQIKGLECENLAEYNKKIQSDKRYTDRALTPLYHLVVIINEIEDLMIVDRERIQSQISQILQLGKQVGIHLVVKTSKPSAEIITDEMRADIPVKIVFNGLNETETESILDISETEGLIGTRYMLFYTPDMEKPIRIQRCHISEKEVIEVTNYLIFNNIGIKTESCDFAIPDKGTYTIEESESSCASESEDKAEDIIDESILGKRLVNCLDRLGVTVQLIDYSVESSYIRYEVIPAPGVSCTQIMKREDDIKVCLGVDRIRFVVPIPGTTSMGIEIPNPYRDILGLQELLQSRCNKDLYSNDIKIPFVLGKYRNEYVIEDMENISSILINGSNRKELSGIVKSMILSMCFNASVDDIELIFLDTIDKEYLSYINSEYTEEIVVGTEIEEKIKELTTEMENRLHMQGQLRKQNALKHKVVFINELADLLPFSDPSIEKDIVRIIRYGKDCGIHLVISSSVTYINKISKPISYELKNRIFTRTVYTSAADSLYMKDADKLLGYCDLIYEFETNDYQPIRIQGFYSE